ncbi:MAG: sugar phosphate isomerase/epimerase [Planctomycetota bacterium]
MHHLGEGKDFSVFVAASTECLPGKSLKESIELLDDLEFAAVEIAMHESGVTEDTRPSEILADEDRAIQLLRHTHRLDISGYSIELASTGDQHYEDFQRICHLAKATKVVTLTVPSAELGTPFNEEVEHLQRLVDLAASEGVRVGVRSQLGCLIEDPDTLMVLCNNVDGLGITLDPSVYIAGPAKGKSLDKILKFVFSTQLRDTRPDAFQVSVGQGEVDYGKLVTQLERENYDRALTVHMGPMEGHDHRVELRKLRRLLETLI